MPCLLGCLALFAPRFVILLVVIFGDWLGEAYRSQLWPFLGFFFMPVTTLAYAWAWHRGAGAVNGFELAVVVVAVLIDLGIVGGNEVHRRRRAST